MYLKSIEAVGFKSFADPTLLEFDRGVTAIVGPNGCGKSNVLDAIRWVLGEQSAKALRGGTMQDVIFGGSDSRKQLGMAEVSLNFSECEDSLGTDYHEVRITRRVFRDGHGEYEINKTPCRLRDIHRLFMDTGIGRSAYSIMEQGRIDQILSSKPEERRAVFEEAAGITRFKSQKKEALRKLEATEANLIRVGDIVKEVNRQIGSLQRQAGKARRYKEMFERLKLLDTHLAAHEFAQLSEEMNEARRRVESLQLEFTNLQSGLDEKEGLLKTKRRELEELNTALQSLEQKKSQLENKAASARQQITFNENRIRELGDLCARNRAGILEIEEKFKVQTAQKALAETEAAQIRTEVAGIESDLKSAQTALEEAKAGLAANARERNTLTAQIGGIDEQINRARQEKTTIEARQTAQGERLEQLRLELPQAEQALAGSAARVETATAALQSAVKAAEDAKAVVEKSLVSLQEATAEASACEAACKEASTAQQQAEMRLNALEEVIRSQEGFSQTTRKLLEAKENSGIIAALVDLIRVTPGHGEAVRICLGAAWEALVVEHPDRIDPLVASLQSGTSVLAWNSEEPKSWRNLFDRIPAESATHVVEPDPRVAGLVHRLLKGFVIADDADHAARLSRKYPRHHVVSRAGEAWFREGWQIRGSHDESSGEALLEYKSQSVELASRLPTLNSELDRAQKALDAARAQVKEKQSAVDAARNQASAADSVVRDRELELKTARHDAETQQKTRDRLASELDKLQGSQSSPSGRGLDEWDAEIAARLAEKKEATDQLARLQDDAHQLQSRVEERNQSMTDAKVREASVRQRLKGAEQQRNAIAARIVELTQQRDRATAEITDYEAKIAESRQSVTAAEQSIAASSEELTNLTDQFNDYRKRRDALGEELVRLDDSTSGERRKATELQGRFGKEEIGVAQARMKLEALVERVRKTYNIDLHHWHPGKHAPRTPEELRELDLEPIEGRLERGTHEMENWVVKDSLFRDPSQDPLLGVKEVDWDIVRAEAADIADKIDRMGPVNVEAITEYEELEDRQRFLQQQEEDLTRSRDQLHEAIRRINQTTKVMFAETFEKVRKNFAEMFQELFGGGHAEISLDNENDPLESGIEIVARPPGKQPKSITLLSGGEKTMTAVALLFGIYMVKPSPFCFLDEMDAPLDESNINRFIRILQRFVRQSQFCVITHNKRTISAADVLYGVTMQEQGVSRLVSMRMNRKDESPLFNVNDTDDDPPNIADAVRSGPVVSA